MGCFFMQERTNRCCQEAQDLSDNDIQSGMFIVPYVSYPILVHASELYQDAAGTCCYDVTPYLSESL